MGHRGCHSGPRQGATEVPYLISLHRKPLLFPAVLCQQASGATRPHLGLLHQRLLSDLMCSAGTKWSTYTFHFPSNKPPPHLLPLQIMLVLVCLYELLRQKHFPRKLLRLAKARASHLYSSSGMFTLLGLHTAAISAQDINVHRLKMTSYWLEPSWIFSQPPAWPLRSGDSFYLTFSLDPHQLWQEEVVQTLPVGALQQQCSSALKQVFTNSLFNDSDESCMWGWGGVRCLHLLPHFPDCTMDVPKTALQKPNRSSAPQPLPSFTKIF